MAESTQPRSRKSTISQNDPSLFGGKVPPQNIEAEKSLLGSVLLDSTTFPDILEKLKPIDFYHQIHELGSFLFCILHILPLFLLLDFHIDLFVHQEF